jgi:hypothetical protein
MRNMARAIVLHDFWYAWPRGPRKKAFCYDGHGCQTRHCAHTDGNARTECINALIIRDAGLFEIAETIHQSRTVWKISQTLERFCSCYFPAKRKSKQVNVRSYTKCHIRTWTVTLAHLILFTFQIFHLALLTI